MGSLTADVRQTTTCPIGGASNSVAYYDDVSLSLNQNNGTCPNSTAGCFAETISSVTNGNATYTTTLHSPDGIINASSSGNAPPVATFHRRWIIEGDQPVAGTRRVTVLVTLLSRSDPPGGDISDESGEAMNTMTRTTLVCRRDSSERRRNGFSLVELIVAMGIFMLISGFALTLFRDQQIASQGLAGQVGLNLSLRNAVAQMQMDLANAGSGYYQNLNMPSWPVGVTIVNNVVPQGSACNDAGTFTYGAACFDQVNIISGVDPNVTPPINATGPGNCSDTSSR